MWVYIAKSKSMRGYSYGSNTGFSEVAHIGVLMISIGTKTPTMGHK